MVSSGPGSDGTRGDLTDAAGPSRSGARTAGGHVGAVIPHPPMIR
jgi:hypothetical protein